MTETILSRQGEAVANRRLDVLHDQAKIFPSKLIGQLDIRIEFGYIGCFPNNRHGVYSVIHFRRFPPPWEVFRHGVADL